MDGGQAESIWCGGGQHRGEQAMSRSFLSPKNSKSREEHGVCVCQGGKGLIEDRERVRIFLYARYATL